jgi:hypothetical protein
MAKRKGARQAASAKKSAPRRAPKKKAARPVARKRAAASRKTSPTSARRAAARKKKAAPARKAARKKGATKKATRRARPAKAASSRPRARALAVKRKTAAAKGIRRAAGPARPAARKTVPASERKAPSLNRNRRVVLDDEIVSSPPSSLDMDRTASAARSGRKAFYDRLEDHPEVSPVITAGDVDADWESAYSVGDEAPGGDNPTPDQDIVDDIGRAVGNEYQDNEPLKGADKIIQRDKHRWELDPGSKEDFDEED